MPQSLSQPINRLRRMRGFTLVELLIVVTVILIVTATATPMFVRAIQNYRLTDAATQVAAIMKAARFEAIQRNTTVIWRISQAGNTTRLWVDINRDGVFNPTEKLVQFNTNINVVAPAGAPNAAGLAAAIGVAGLTAVPPANGNLTFDSRGAVTNPPAAYVVYISEAPTAGNYFRAVILLPSGITQVWTAGAGGAWQELY
jgi:prepilin-type N-terminal cleavage/methylation domain-containing protein